MRINEELYKQHLENIAHLENESSLYCVEARHVRKFAERDHDNADNFLQLLHVIQRLNKIHVAGLSHNQAFFDACAKEKLPLWKDYSAPAADLALQEEHVNKLYNIRSGKNDVGLIHLGSQVHGVGKLLVEKCDNAGAPFMAAFHDPVFDALVLSHADKAGLRSLNANEARTLARVNRIMTANFNLPAQKTIADEGFTSADRIDMYFSLHAAYNKAASNSKGEAKQWFEGLRDKSAAVIDALVVKDQAIAATHQVLAAGTQSLMELKHLAAEEGEDSLLVEIKLEEVDAFRDEAKAALHEVENAKEKLIIADEEFRSLWMDVELLVMTDDAAAEVHNELYPEINKATEKYRQAKGLNP